MAITAYTGLPGSGKSYGVVERVVLASLDNGRRLITNLALKQNLLDKYPDQVTLITLDDIEADEDFFSRDDIPGAIVVIDEVQLLWRSGTTVKSAPKKHLQFLTEHRHMVGSDGKSTDVVLITQDLSNVAAFARNLVETTFRYVKLTSIGQDKKYRVDVYSQAATGPNPPQRDRLRQLFGQYKPEVYQYYTSQTMNESDDHGEEVRIDSRVNVLNSPFFRLGLPALVIVGGVFIWYGFSETASMYNGDHETVADQVDQANQAPINQAPIAPLPDPVHPLKGYQLRIAFNMGHWPWIEYRISATRGDERASFSQAELARLGYRLLPINQCFVQLVRQDTTLNVQCADSSQSDNDGFNLSI